MTKPVLTCFGGVGTVTGANFMLEVPSTTSGSSKKYLIDCGLLQGVQGASAINDAEFEYDVADIEALFITHAHIDHIGRIPRLIESGYKGPIYSTPETLAISELMLRDLVHIEGMGETLVEKSLQNWHPLPYHQSKQFDGFKIEPFNSGHILGSAMYKFTFDSGKSIMFTGDLGNSPSPLLQPVEEIRGLDYLLMESVYGDRNHNSQEVRDKNFSDLIKESVEHKRSLIIPVFSLERSQLLLFELHKMFQEGQIRNVPVYLDSPLAIKITEVYKHLTGKDVFDFPMLHETSEVRDSKAIADVPAPKIILAGSGMSTAGRILFHEARYLPDPNAVILFAGFQAAGTLGRQIQEGEKSVIINESKVQVRAKVVSINGYSAHAGSDQLVDFVSHSKDTLKKVFVAMGEPKSSIFLAQRLHDELEVEAMVPERGKRYELDL